jgi:hypothetical protein
VTTAISKSTPEQLLPAARMETLLRVTRVLLPVVVLQALGLLGLSTFCGWLLYRDTHRSPLYFATDGRGHVTQLAPLSEPVLTKQAAAQYLVDCIGQTLSIDYVNFSDQLSQASRCYSTDAHNLLVKQLEDQGIFEMLKTKKLVLRAVASGAPRVVAEGSPRPGDPFTWVVQVPVVWTFAGAQRDVSLQYLVQGVVTRADLTERPEGVAITSISITRSQGASS